MRIEVAQDLLRPPPADVQTTSERLDPALASILLITATLNCSIHLASCLLQPKITCGSHTSSKQQKPL
jgi:hypothetical protein